MEKVIKQENITEIVRSQYEDYPYPPRNPEDERRRLATPYIDALDSLNYYCFEGRGNFSNGFRALVAGGGTGDSAIFLAEQLKEFGGEVTYLDISKASMEVAQQRARTRSLSNIKWVNDSLLNLPTLNLGTFDYINCSGVLHHLAKPEQGLACLTQVLKENGAMGLMLYAPYGREGVYQMQRLLQLMQEGEEDKQKNVDQCKEVIQLLPPSHIFKLTEKRFTDLKLYGDVGVYDLLLHAQDRAYSIPELYEFIEKEGLQLLQLFGRHELLGNALYQPETYIKNEMLLAEVKMLDIKRQQAIAELLHGRITKHVCYLSKHQIKRPAPEDLAVIPAFTSTAGNGIYQTMYNHVKAAKGKVVFKSEGVTIEFPKTQNTELLFKYLDGKRSLKEIFQKVMASPSARTGKPSFLSLTKEFKEIFAALNSHGWMFLSY